MHIFITNNHFSNAKTAFLLICLLTTNYEVYTIFYQEPEQLSGKKESKMSPHLKWGLIMGGVVALLNLIGAALIGIINNFLSILTVAIAATMAGYYCAWQEPLEQRVKAGGIAGTIVGVINLISQLAGGVISWLISMESLVSFYSSHMSSNSPSITEGVRTSLEITVILAIVVGIILIFGAAGIGALAAKLSAPKIETKRN